MIRTITGHWVDLSKPKPSDVHLNTIATGLSNICRFAGQVEEFYSVAQHAVLVSRLGPEHLRRHFLHHDDSEALMGDISHHLKHHPFLAGYRMIEQQFTDCINTALGLRVLSAPEHRMLKLADHLAGIYEFRVLRLARPWVNAEEAIDWAVRSKFTNMPAKELLGLAMHPQYKQALSVNMRPLTPRQARSAFIQEHFALFERQVAH